MAKPAVIVDASFLIALWCRRDRHHPWAVALAKRMPPPWITCEAAVSEGNHLLAPNGSASLRVACRRGALVIRGFEGEAFLPVLELMDKYADVPMSVADACLVRLCEVVANPVVFTTDADFKIYRRFGSRLVPLRMP